jgi:hypothetical protein
MSIAIAIFAVCLWVAMIWFFVAPVLSRRLPMRRTPSHRVATTSRTGWVCRRRLALAAHSAAVQASRRERLGSAA